MKRFLCFFILVYGCLSSSWSQTDSSAGDERGYIVKVGDMVPDFTMNLLDGSTLRMGDLRGKIVMLQFTASWCGVCRKEMPFIEKDIWQQHRSNPKFALIGIDKDEKADVVSRFVQSVGVSYPMAEKQQQTQIEKQAEFEAVITTVAETYPDFDSVVQAGLQRDLPMPLTLDEVASEFGYSSETQVKLLYEIGKNEALHETLSGSSKLKAARILSEIVDSWETKPAPKVSKAPPPIKPVQANAPAARSPEKMSDDEWYRAETQLRKGK